MYAYMPTHLFVRFLSRYWSLLLATAAFVYFSFHLVHGDRGLVAMERLKTELAETKERHAAQLAELQALEGKVELLKRGHSDPDMVEEQLRLLGYVGEREVVILERPR